MLLMSPGAHVINHKKPPPKPGLAWCTCMAIGMLRRLLQGASGRNRSCSLSLSVASWVLLLEIFLWIVSLEQIYLFPQSITGAALHVGLCWNLCCFPWWPFLQEGDGFLAGPLNGLASLHRGFPDASFPAEPPRAILFESFAGCCCHCIWRPSLWRMTSKDFIGRLHHRLHHCGNFWALQNKA